MDLAKVWLPESDQPGHNRGFLGLLFAVVSFRRFRCSLLNRALPTARFFLYHAFNSTPGELS